MQHLQTQAQLLVRRVQYAVAEFLCSVYNAHPNLHDTIRYQFFFPQQELDMEGSPKPAVFILHNLLSARVHSLPTETATQPL